MHWDAIIDLYERHAADFDRDRARDLQETAWLDRFLALVPTAGTVLDIGCGVGEPIGRYLRDAGARVTGVDASPSLVDICRSRVPDADWIVADMRSLALGRRFDALLAWNSFFHLHPDDQRRMFARFAAHAQPGAPLMFTSGSRHGEAIGSWCGEPLYHGSLASSEYETLLAAHGFDVVAHVIEDQACGGLTVWLARDRRRPAGSGVSR
jgi:trans-aconitate methyltransferase